MVSIGRMRAIGVTEYGGPDALREVRLEPEPLGPGQVRVRVLAAAVNPTDTLLRSGATSDAPRARTVDVPGMDVCGTVLEIGSPDGRLQVGHRVMGIVVPDGEHGAYRDDVVLPAASVVGVPRGLTDAEAASIPMNALTACLALEVLGLDAGATLAVTGAAGAMGGCMVQLAKAAGLVVVADAKDDDEELVRSLGADSVVPRGPGFAAGVRSEHPDGVDALVDASLQGSEVASAVRDGGSVVTVRGWDGNGDQRISYHSIRVRWVAERLDLLEHVHDLVESGLLLARVADVFPAAEAAAAHRRLEAGGVRGRLVLDLTTPAPN